jgi:protein-disulfide isomerase
MSDPSSPWFQPPPPPPPPKPGPSRSAGLKTLAITLGVLVGVAGAAIVVLPYVLDKKSPHDDEPTQIEKPKKQKPSPKIDDHAKVANALPILSTDPVRGTASALVTIMVFGDFQDPFTARLNTTIEDLRAKYGKDLRVVWKDYPLAFHKEARPAAKLARVAMLEGGVGPFFKLHDKILANQKDLATELETWASDVGADSAAVGRHGKRADEQIDATTQLAKDLGVPGTPCSFIDGEKLSGARSQTDFEKVIDAHLIEAKKLLADGTKQEDLYAELVDRHFDDNDPTAGGTLYRLEVTGLPAIGKKDALVTAVVFVDPERPPATRMPLADLGKLADVRVVLRDLPSTPKGTEAAAILRAIGDKAGEEERARAIEEIWTSFPPDLVTFAVGYGLSSADARAAIAGATKLKSLDDDRDAAEEVDAALSPQTSLFINGRKQWSWTRSDVVSIVDRERKRASRMVAKGTPAADVYEEIIKKGTRKPRKHVTLTIPAYAPVRGPASAKVVIHAFSDFQCPFCKRSSEPTGGFAMAVAANSADVRVVFRHNPLTFHLMAEPAAEMAIEAKKQKGVAAFFRVHDRLFALAPPLDMTKIESVAMAEGLDMPKVKAAIAGKLHKKEIDEDMAEARRIGALGTPAFVVGDELISGAQTQAMFESAIKRAKAKAP